MLTLMQARKLPENVEAHLDEIAEDALQAAFALIVTRLDRLGFPVTGDVSPDEAVQLDETFRSFVRMMALNNDTIGAMQEGGE